MPAGASIKSVSVGVLIILPSMLISSTCSPCTVMPVELTVPTLTLFTVNPIVSFVG